MKPKNKFQKQIFELSKNLPSISRTQIKRAYQNCFVHTGRRTKKGVVSCLECGHSWTDRTAETHCICPNCSTKLQIYDTKQRVFKDYQYLCIISVCGDFQVLRFLYIKYSAKVGEKARYFHSEVVQRWISPAGKYATIAKLRPTGYFSDAWLFGSALEIRPEKPVYDIIPTCISSRCQVIQELNRRGFNGQFYNLTPFDLFRALLTDSRAETLLKTGQTALLQHFAGSNRLKDYWASIKICIRNGYTVKDASVWCDYIDLLRFFGRDLHNAKYVCPDRLNAEHDRYVRKKQDWQERENRERARKKALEDEARFREMKSKFFGIQFSDGQINIRVLESVTEIMSEGEAMHHCVFTNDYHLKPDSLILSARIDGKRLETVELSISKMQILQSRGVCNKNTEYHERIIELVKKNIRQVRKRTA